MKKHMSRCLFIGGGLSLETENSDPYLNILSLEEDVVLANIGNISPKLFLFG